MSKGNLNTYGNKKSNFPFQQSVLLLLDALTKANSTTGLAQESTLISVLNAIVASDQDVEILLVRDTGNGNVVLQQITDYQTGVPVVTYKDVNGNVVVPVGPLEYLDPSAVLNLVLAELVTLNAGGQLLTEATFVAEDFATQTTLAAINVKLNTLGQKASASSVPVVLSTEQEVILDAIRIAVEAIDLDTNGLAQEVTLAATNVLLTTIDSVLDNILLDTTAILADTTTLSTPDTTVATSLLRVAGAGSVTAGKRRASFFNAGGSTVTVSGGSLLPGEAVSFIADGIRDTLAAIAYDGTGSDLLITTIG